MKGYKIFNPDFKCRDFQFAENTEYKINQPPIICERGFHFCTKASHCFSYYEFNPSNIICEVEAIGDVVDHPEDSKHSTNHIKIGRRLTWAEVLTVANEGCNNTGHSNSGNRNSGDRNSGNWNSGDRNSGNWNSGDRNSGDSNSGNWNSGNWNSGNRNSGNWNSGDSNSGDSNSGYRNSGAFCIDNDPELILFDKPSGIKVRSWESGRICMLLSNLDPTIWVPSSIMTDDEKKTNPRHETTEGYLKTISMHEAWANLWGNLTESDRQLFIDLPNFDAEKFKIITGITIKQNQ